VSLNDDDSFIAYDDEFRHPVGVEKKAEPMTLTFDDRKYGGFGRDEFLAETSLAIADDTWTSECSGAVARRCNDDALSLGTWPTHGRSVSSLTRTKQFENRQKQLSPVTDRSPADSSTSSSLNQYSTSAVQPEITVSVPNTDCKTDGRLVREVTPSCIARRDGDDPAVTSSVEREATPNRIPPPPPIRVLFVPDICSTHPADHQGGSSCIVGKCGNENVTDRRMSTTSSMMSPAGDQPLQPNECMRSRQNSTSRDDNDNVDQILTSDNSSDAIRSRLRKQQHLLPTPAAKTTEHMQSQFGRSFPDLSAFDVMSSPFLSHHHQIQRQQQQLQQQQNASAVMSSAPVTLDVPTFIRNIPTFDAYRAQLDSASSSHQCHDDTVQLLAAEGTVDVTRGNSDDLYDQQWMQQLRPSPGTLRPNHSSIW